MQADEDGVLCFANTFEWQKESSLLTLSCEMVIGATQLRATLTDKIYWECHDNINNAVGVFYLLTWKFEFNLVEGKNKVSNKSRVDLYYS